MATFFRHEMAWLVGLHLLVCGPANAADFLEGLVPISKSAVFGNSIFVETSKGEQFVGFAWPEGKQGYFCFVNDSALCGGTYNSETNAPLIDFTFVCLDGRKGQGVSERLVGKLGANPLRAQGQFSDGVSFRAEFGVWSNYPNANCAEFAN